MQRFTVLEVAPGEFITPSNNPTLDSLDGERRAPLLTILHESWKPAERAKFGVFIVEIPNAPAGQSLSSLTFERNESGKVVGNATYIPTPAPASVTPLQMRKALRAAGLKPTVDGYIATLSEEAQEAWEYATAVDRDNQLIADAATGLGMTPEQVDDLFRSAASM